MKDFKQWLLKNRTEKKLRVFFDVETLQYNENKGKDKPSLYKNVVYCFAISYIDIYKVKVVKFPSIKFFLDTIFTTYTRWKVRPSFELIAHNNNKYDNHFLKSDLLFYYPKIIIKNLFLTQATDLGNQIALKEKQISKEEKEKGIFLEKRVKSSNNLEIIFFIEGVKFYTTDNYMKTNASIKTLGKKLHRLDLISEDELKTDYNYTKYNLKEDMGEENARRYAESIFHQLDKNELTYIDNDVIILAKSVINYSKIFKGFDYEKITFTSNILEYYNNNDLTNFQLLRRYDIDGKKKFHLKFTDYKFNNQNLYDYIKKYYSGGLNFYNAKFIGTFLKNLFSIDINSSYPYVMHNFKVPTFVKSDTVYDIPTKITLKKIYNDNIFTLYEISKQKFDEEIIENIESKIIKQMLVKYYGKHDNIYINNWTIKLIENITNLKINTLTIKSKLEFECYYFGSRGEIEEEYFIKTQGANENVIEYNSPYDIKVTDKINTEKFTQEEVDISKVKLNGLYGIPALRPFFNLFRTNGTDLFNIENGFINNERNIIFSVFVTAVSLYNLLSPLHYLTPEEIDKNVIYMDTDSLFLRREIYNKIPKSFYHKYHLGKWDIDHDLINKMYVLNHKKYAIVTNGKIIVKCGGIPNESFDTNMSFEKFIETQFSDGIQVHNTKSIMNKQGTISIYPSTTNLEIGKGYPIYAYDENLDKLRESIKKQVRDVMKDGGDDALFIESNIGTFSLAELTPYKHNYMDKEPIEYLYMAEKKIKRILNLTE